MSSLAEPTIDDQNGRHGVTDKAQNGSSGLSGLESATSDDVMRSASPDDELQVQMEGHMEKRGFDEQWYRYWCLLRDGCLYCYLKPTDEVSSDVTELKGYEVTQLIDKFQGKRFVLSLKHPGYIDVLLSVDSRDELTDWYEAVKANLVNVNKKVDEAEDVSESQTKMGEGGSLPKSPSGPAADTSQNQHPPAGTSPSAQTVKQKLLAEMLRQKLELEKMQAARNGMRSDVHLDSRHRSASPTLGSSLSTDDDRICALTRLRQRRMSTQIKLQTIQKEMEASTTSPKEKKTVFQLGKKKPDLVQGHSEGHGNRSDLEEQVKLLSSRLQELDSCITSHGAISPREDSPAKTITKNKSVRHSYDQSLLRDIIMSESKRDSGGDFDEDVTLRPKEKDKDKDGSKNSGLKSSVQKFAHRTFAKATWHWHKKSSNQNVDKDSIRTSSTGSSGNLSDLTPDVIDMTNNNSQLQSKYHSLDTGDIPAPPDNFRTEYTLLTSTLPHRGKSGTLRRTPKERILSKLSTSSSLTHLDRFNSRLESSSSTPSLAKLSANKQEEKGRHISDGDSVDSGGVVPKLTNGSLEGSSNNWSAPNSARSQGSSGLVSPRREVNPNALAEIEAFEELSMKVLGSSTSAMK